MWIVYLKDPAGIDWGHKYFHLEENARKHFEMLEKVKMYSLPCIRRILTEDSPDGLALWRIKCKSTQRHHSNFWML